MTTNAVYQLETTAPLAASATFSVGIGVEGVLILNTAA